MKHVICAAVNCNFCWLLSVLCHEREGIVDWIWLSYHYTVFKIKCFGSLTFFFKQGEDGGREKVGEGKSSTSHPLEQHMKEDLF